MIIQTQRWRMLLWQIIVVLSCCRIKSIEAQSGTTVRINVNGPAFTDSSNLVWEADATNKYFSGGIGFTNCPRSIANTVEDPLFCTYRYWTTIPTLPATNYAIPVANGSYQVTLFFAETHFNAAAKRVFDITLEGNTVRTNYDIFAAAGGMDIATNLTFTVTVSDAMLNIAFRNKANNPLVNAIQILPSAPAPSTPPSTPTPPTSAPTAVASAVRINVAGGEYFDPNTYNVWMADQYIVGSQGAAFGSCGAAVLNTTLQPVYCTNRWLNGNLKYEIPVPSGNWEIRLMFAEIFFTAPGQRTFHIFVEGSLAVSNLDVFVAAGSVPRTALVIPVTRTISDGFVSLELVKVINNPIINGIEILPVTGPVSPPTKAPLPLPTKAPVPAPTKAPAPLPTKAPAPAPTKAPVPLPTKTPVPAPTKAPALVPTNAPTLAPVASVRINAGGPAFTDPNMQSWIVTAYVVGNVGNNYGSCSSDILNTTLKTLYCTNRWYGGPGDMTFEVPVPSNRTWEVRLHFAELYFTAVNKRVFNVWIEDQLAVKNLDVFARAGPRTAMMISFTTNIMDGFATIKFVKNIENPMVSGIEIIPSTGSPTPQVTDAPTRAPVSDGTILINCGGQAYTEVSGERVWSADQFFQGGGTYYDGGSDIADTLDDIVYFSERNGNFAYNIPVQIATYEVTLHFAELYFTSPGQRVFNIDVEGTKFSNFDVIAYGGSADKKVTLVTVALVEDGVLTISLTDGVANMPKLSGIEIKPLALHLAHSVPQGPYKAVDINNQGSAVVLLDGSPSHTHAVGKDLSQFIWKLGATTVATTMMANVSFPVGEHTISLTVIDNAGNTNTDSTTIIIYPNGYPAITSLSSQQGSVAGGNSITITGSGFGYSSSQIKVHFGLIILTGSEITIINPQTITLNVPPAVLGAPVLVSVETPLAVSNTVTYTYVASSPIDFISSQLYAIDGPTRAAFGPDKKLYIGTINGKLARLTLNDDFTQVLGAVVSTVANYRLIGGIAFDPMETNSTFPSVYISHSFLFHGEAKSTSGQAINGKVSRVSGANLDQITDIITGLPVSDHDHAIVGLVFGDKGELYVQVGSNTNAGIPGPLSGTQLQKENYYSAATLVAHLSRPTFNGAITYNALDDGTPNGGSGIEVFASGERNPYGLVLHSNGKLYATDNGPNGGYGAISTGCGANDFAKEFTTKDELNLLVKGGYYGSPNRKRAAVDGDTRQCIYHPPTDISAAGYTAPLLSLTSSTNGIIEYEADHFGGQLRGNLIASKYTDGLFRIVLTPDGQSVIPQSDPALPLVGDDGLDVTQAPDGSLVEVRIATKNIFIHKPNEASTTELRVNAVYPRRGGNAGGYLLSVYGVNFSANAAVIIGGNSCSIQTITSSMITCTAPGGQGVVDIVVTGTAGTYTFKRGFRYITGFGSQ